MKVSLYSITKVDHMNRSFHTLLNNGVRVLKEDSLTGLIALYKPPLIKSHPNTNISDTKSLLTCIYDHNNECYIDNNNKVWLLNRLDSITSGIILVSTNERTALSVKKEFANRKVIKHYKALVFGSNKALIINKKIKWTNNITIDHHHHHSNSNSKGKLRALSSTSNNKDNLIAISYASIDKCIDNNPSMLLIDLQLITGYTHQLRLQSSQNGLPIVGDKVYGNFNLNKLFNEKYTSLNKRLYLHSYSIHLKYEFNNKQYEFQCVSSIQDEPGFSTLINESS